jgi:hypothetical protein
MEVFLRLNARGEGGGGGGGETRIARGARAATAGSGAFRLEGAERVLADQVQ